MKILILNVFLNVSINSTFELASSLVKMTEVRQARSSALGSLDSNEARVH